MTMGMPPNAPPGAPPLPLPPRGAPPPDPITSPHQGNRLDLIRTALMALQHYAEQETDDQEIATVHKCMLALQNILATHAKNRDAAMGITPALQHTRRVSGGNY
jgi:hypothetical protein